MKTLSISGRVLVSDILLAFEPMVEADLLLKLDEHLKGKTDDRIDFDDVEVSVEAAVDAVDEAGALPPPEGLSDTLDESDVRILAEAIRTGDVKAAEMAMDHMFGHDPELREWIDQGRYSRKARHAALPVASPVRKVA